MAALSKEHPMWPFRSDRKIPGWRKFEDSAGARLLKNFTDHHCSTQKVSRTTGKRPDLFLRSKTDGQRTIVDFKYCLDAKPAHLKQVCGYKGHPFFAQRGILVYPKNARMSEAFLNKAAERKIEVRRDRLSKKRSVFGQVFRAIARKKKSQSSARKRR
jgi:hypothetical protein